MATQTLAPETPLASQPKTIKPPTTTPQTGLSTNVPSFNSTGGINYGTPTIQNLNPTQGIIKAPSVGTLSTTSQFGNTTPAPAPTPISTPTSTGSPLYQNKTPWLNGDYSFNKDYKPTSDQEYQSAVNYLRNDYTDPYAQQKLAQITANYQGLNTSTANGINMNPTSAEGAAATQKALNTEAKTKLDQEIEYNTQKAQTQEQGNIGAINAGIGAVNREGITSTSNQMAAGQAVDQFTSDFNQYKQELANQQQQLDEAQASGNTQLAQQITQAMSSTQAVMQQHLQDQVSLVKSLNELGAFNNMTPEQVQAVQSSFGSLPAGAIASIAKTAQQAQMTTQQKAQTGMLSDAINQFVTLNASGVQITPAMIQQTAQATGVQPQYLQSAAAGFNQTVSAIQQDKTLTAEQKQVAVQQAQQNLQDQINGYTTQAGENVKLLGTLQRNGADPKLISAVMKSMGVPDTNDPMYQADLQLKQAQATRAYKEANGIPITDADRASEAEAREKLSYLQGGAGGADSYYVPNAPLEDIKVGVDDNGKYTVTPPANKEFQCGAFVNRVWGLSGGSGSDYAFGSLGSEKDAVVDKHGFQTKGKSDEDLASMVKPGMAFVMPIANNPYDHVGLVQSVLPGGITTIEANANGRAKTSSVGPGKSNVTSGRFIPWNQLYGFVPPPSSNTQVQGRPADIHNQYMQEAKAAGLDYDAAKKYASDKTLTALNSSNNANPDAETNANQIVKGLMSFGDISKKDNQAMSAAIAKIDPTFSVTQAKSNAETLTKAQQNQDVAKASSLAIAATDTFQNVIDLAQKLADKGIIQGNQPFNATVLSAAQQTGDQDASAYSAALEELKGEIASVISGGYAPNSSQMDELNKAINGSLTLDQLKKQSTVLTGLMANRVKGLMNRNGLPIYQVSKNPDIQKQYEENLLRPLVTTQMFSDDAGNDGQGSQPHDPLSLGVQHPNEIDPLGINQ